jgi:GNAT superfamily N-acetyltransferase
MANHLRRATPDDAAAVRALVRASYAKWVPIIGREPVPMTADYDLAVRNHIVDLLFVDDELTALIELVVEPESVLIENVAVRPGEARKGHGRYMMAHAADVARIKGRKRLRLYTNRLMIENIALYERLGYAIDERETTPDGREIVYMSIAV